MCRTINFCVNIDLFDVWSGELVWRMVALENGVHRLPALVRLPVLFFRVSSKA